MLKPILMTVLFVVTCIPSLLFADSSESLFASVSAASKQAQPGLQNYTVTVETSRIDEMMNRMTSGIPADVAPPPSPVIIKFWQRNGEGVIYADQVSNAPYVEKMVEQISGNLAIELNEMLLPEVNKDLRQKLLRKAEVRSSEVALAKKMIQHLEINFAQPTDLGEAFYVSGMRLPQKQVRTLTFDIDSSTSTINEVGIMTDNGLHLTMEIRYQAVDGGHIPERFQVTSPDGKIDDLFEVRFLEIDGFQLPESMSRTIRRPNLHENLEVAFKNYKINRPVSEEIKARLKSQ